MPVKQRLLTLGVGEIVVSPNIRGDIGPEDAARMAGDLLEAGCQLQPVGVRRYEGQWVLVYGHRRVAGLQWIRENHTLPEDSPLRHVLAIEVPSREEDMILQIRENSARRNMRPCEEAEIIEDLISGGRSVDEVAKIFGRSPGWVSQRRALLSLPAEIQSQIGSRISPYDGYLVSKMKPSERDARLRVILGQNGGKEHTVVRRKRPTSRDAVRLLSRVRSQTPAIRPLLDSLILFFDGRLSAEETERRLKEKP